METADTTIAGLAKFLLRNVAAIRQMPDAHQAMDEIHAAVRHAERAIDRPPDLSFVGACDDCGLSIYARPGEPAAVCRCGSSYSVPQRREAMLQAIDDRLGNATEISRALTGLGRHVTPSAIRGYAYRGRLASHGTDALRHPLYRIGDVLDVITRDNESPRERGRRPGDTANLTS